MSVEAELAVEMGLKWARVVITGELVGIEHYTGSDWVCYSIKVPAGSTPSDVLPSLRSWMLERGYDLFAPTGGR